MPRPEKLVVGLMAIQVILSLSVMLLHPGFDKKNDLGLDFDFVIAMVVVAGFTWIAGLVFALQLEARKGRYLIGHLVTLVFGVLFFALV
ncbi:MAG TPA: hypothetical protein VIM71_05680 [Lacunisphaera sp.]